MEAPDSILHPKPRIYWHYPTGDTPRMKGRPAVKVVKNLGWVLANARYVTAITLHKTAGAHIQGHGARAAFDGEKDGLKFTFICDFASYIVARQWVTRPSMLHASVHTPRYD